MVPTLRTVLSNPTYALIASALGLVVFSIAVWLPNLTLIVEVFFSDGSTVIEKFHFLFSLYGGIITNFTLLSASYTVSIAALFGIYTALLIFYVRSRKSTNQMRTTSLMGIGGVISGFFGIGCAACGTFILSSLTTVGGSGALFFLPMGGKIFGFVGMALLVYAIYSITKKIKEPLLCK